METIVFTNGCFDIIHPGHIDLLKRARRLGTKLIVGINSDRSIREIKGAPRPFLNQGARTAVLRELRSVDEVRIFDENTPERLIKEIKPHVLVKGGDWQPEQIIGADFVIENGGKVFSIPFREDISTTRIVEKIQSAKENVFSEPRNSEVIRANKKPSTAIFKLFRESEIVNIKRAKSIISGVLASSDGRIRFSGTAATARAARRLTEDFTDCFGSERVFDSGSDIENSFQAEDLLIVVGDETESADLAGEIVKARRANAKIIVLTGRKGRKLAALSDVCVLLPTDFAGEIFWLQSAIINFWMSRTSEIIS